MYLGHPLFVCVLPAWVPSRLFIYLCLFVGLRVHPLPVGARVFVGYALFDSVRYCVGSVR